MPPKPNTALAASSGMRINTRILNEILQKSVADTTFQQTQQAQAEIKVKDYMKPNISYKMKSYKKINNPIPKEIKVTETETKSEEAVKKPMKLKFCFWQKGSKTHSLSDKERLEKNKDVFARAQRPQELSTTKNILPVAPYEGDALFNKKPMNLRANFWTKASKTVFLETKKGQGTGYSRSYTSKDFTPAKPMPSKAETTPMNLKSQFRFKEAKTTFIKKVS